MFRHKWLFLSCFFAVFASATVYSLVLTRLYRSDAMLAVKFENENQNIIPGVAISAQSPEHQEIINTNVRLLKSTDLLTELITKFGALKLYPRLADVHDSVTLADLARAQLLSDLRVTADHNSDVIDVSLSNPDAAVASAALSDLIRLFIERQARLYRATQPEVMRDQVEMALRRLSESQTNLDSFASKFGISSLDDELSGLLRREMDMHTALDQQRSRLGEALGRRHGAATGLAGLNHQIVLSDENRGYKGVDDPGSLIANYRQHTAVTGPNPVSQQTQTDLVRADEDVQAARGSITALEQQLREIRDRLQELTSRRAEYQALKMQRETDEKSYRAFVQRANDSRVADALNGQNINAVVVLQAATVPMGPIGPRVKLILGLGLLLGCMVGVTASMISEMLDETFSLPDQVEAVLGLLVLGTLKQAPTASGRCAA
jgi:uncharacterized protein involved in exopolysaccharide biosynthesis